MTISEKSAYLKGLMDGLSLNTETDEGKMISAIVDLLGDMAKRVTDIEETTIAISDELDEIEEDLDAIEDYILDEEDDDDFDFVQLVRDGNGGLLDVGDASCHIAKQVNNGSDHLALVSLLAQVQTVHQTLQICGLFRNRHNDSPFP